MSDRKTHTKKREKYYFQNNTKSSHHTHRERETENNKNNKTTEKDTVRRVRGKRIHTLFCFMRKRSEKQFYQ